LEDLKERYLSFVEHQHGIVTKQIHFAHFKHVWGNPPIHTLTVEVLDQYRALRRAENVGPATINREMATLKHAFYLEETDNLVSTWTGRVLKYLTGLDGSIARVSSRSIKKALKADKVAPRTWARIIRSIPGSNKTIALKNSMGDGTVWEWRLEGGNP
jgi:hypothetical protein